MDEAKAFWLCFASASVLETCLRNYFFADGVFIFSHLVFATVCISMKENLERDYNIDLQRKYCTTNFFDSDARAKS